MAFILAVDAGRTTGGTINGWQAETGFFSNNYSQSNAGDYDVSGLSTAAPEFVFDSDHYTAPGEATLFTAGGLSPSTQYKLYLFFAEHSSGYSRNMTIVSSVGNQTLLTGYNPQTAAAALYGVTFANATYKAVVEIFTVTSNASGEILLSLTSSTSYGSIRGVAVETIVVSPVASFTKTPATPTAGSAANFTDTSTNIPTGWLWDFGDGSTSTTQNPSHTFSAVGTYTVSLTATNAAGSSTTSVSVTVEAFAVPTAYPMRAAGLALCVDATANGVVTSSFVDLSGRGRNMTAANPKPGIVAGAINGKAAMRLQRTTNPPKYTGLMFVKCGWILAQSSANFLSYDGLLTALTGAAVLVGAPGTDQFFNFDYLVMEFRQNDRIFPQSDAALPVGVPKLIFFRFPYGLYVDGIQLGQDRGDTTRKFDGYVGMMALYSTDFYEEELRAQTKGIADYWGLTLADVFPYLPEYLTEVEKDKNFLVSKSLNGNRVIRVKQNNSKQKLEANFTEREPQEFNQADRLWEELYPDNTTAIRDYGTVPPRDIVGYITSKITRKNRDGLIDYSFEFEEA